MSPTRCLRAGLCLALLAGCAPHASEPPTALLPPGGAVMQSPLPGTAPMVAGDAGPVPLGLRSSVGRASGPPEVVMGTGRFVARPANTAAGVQAAAEGSDVTLDFAGVDVRDVLKSVLGDLLHVSYAVDPTVQGAMTLQTGHPIPRSSVIDVLNTALQLNGVALVSRDGLYLAMPVANAARQANIGGQEGYVTRVVTLHYVSAADLEKALEPLVPGSSSIKADPARNVLIVTGPAQDVAGIEGNIAAFDIDTMRGLSFALLPLSNGRARDVAADVGNLLRGAGRSMADMVRVTALDRMNAVLVTSMQPAYLRRVQEWVSRFDRDEGRSDTQLFVYRVQNGRAADLASVLRRALGIDAATAGAGSPAAAASADASQQSTGAPPPSGTDMVQSALTGGTSPPATAASPPGSPQLRSDPLASVATAAMGGGATAVLPDVRVTADPVNNAVVVTATPQEYAPIEAALRKLDVTPLQVLIEATVAEVTLTRQLDLGLQYFINSGRFHAIVAPGASPASTATQAQSDFFPGFPGLGFLSGVNAAYGSSTSQVVLQTLAGLTTVRVLSSPNLLVLNNGTARLQVGDQVPIATQSATSTLTDTAQTVNSIAYKDTGVILNVTPRVNAGGLVQIDVSEEVSQPTSTSTSKLNSPTISQRRVTSSVAVNDGQTIALAGLIRDLRQNANNGIPYLKDLPAVGWLFGVRSNSTTRTELIVLLTPRVIRDREEGDIVTRELREKLRLTVPVAARIP